MVSIAVRCKVALRSYPPAKATESPLSANAKTAASLVEREMAMLEATAAVAAAAAKR